MITIEWKALHPHAQLPKFQTKDAAGADCHACLPAANITLHSGEWAFVPFGWAVAIPRGYEMQVRPRSGLALKQGITILNSPGTIDADYRGMCGAILHNVSNKDVIINHGDRIAQVVIAKLPEVDYKFVADLTTTERGAGGFGSTGV